MEQFHGTTIISVRRGDQVCIGGDGQVTLGNTVMKGNARKVRRLYQNKVLAGFAVEQLTPLPYSNDSMRNLKSIRGISPSRGRARKGLAARSDAETTRGHPRGSQIQKLR